MTGPTLAQQIGLLARGSPIGKVPTGLLYAARLLRRHRANPRPSKLEPSRTRLAGSGVLIGGGALPRPWMNAVVSKTMSLASAIMNVSVLPVLPGVTAPPYVTTALPFWTNTPCSGVVWNCVPGFPPLSRKGGIYHERAIDVDWISPRKRDVGAVEKKAKPVDKLSRRIPGIPPR